MPNTVENLLRAMHRSMDEVIAPSVPSDNPLAREQSMLVAKALAFLATQIGYLHQKDRHELLAYSDIAAGILAASDEPERPEALKWLEAAHDRAAAVAVRPDAASNDVTGAVADLTGAICALIRARKELSSKVQNALRSNVLTGSKPVLDLNRSFFLPTGFERSTDAPPPLAEILTRENT
ncbi:MAG: hypothetical protein VX874_09535 [Pseudomonadota bacterium]|nr:hypothetical protein [Pseudomonadota bacterium]